MNILIALLYKYLLTKTANLIKASAAFGSSGKTLGFAADIQVDIDGTEQKNSTLRTTQKGSNILSGGNLTLKAGETAKIEGSELAAKGDLAIDATDVIITAAKETEKSGSRTRHARLNLSYDTSGNWGANADADYSEMDSESVTWKNSRLSAGNITVKSVKDTTVRGGVITAGEKLDMNVGGNLLVESLQDTLRSKSHSLGLGLGYSGSPGGNGMNISANGSKSKGKKDWVNEQTGLTGKSVNIYVEKKTTLTGALIAATTDDLMLTTGTFEYSDIKDRDISYNYGGGVNLGSNRAGSGEKKNNTWSVNANYGYAERRQINFATVGEGNLIVRDGNRDLSKLNRDTTISQYGTVNVGFKGGVTIDSSTVHMVTVLVTTNPKDLYNDIKNEILRDWNDTKETTVGLYEKSENLVSYGKFGLDGDYDVQNARIRDQLEGYGIKFSGDEEANLFKGRIIKLEDGTFIRVALDNSGLWNTGEVTLFLQGDRNNGVIIGALNDAGQAMNEWGAKKNEEITNSRLVTGLNQAGVFLNENPKTGLLVCFGAAAAGTGVPILIEMAPAWGPSLGKILLTEKSADALFGAGTNLITYKLTAGDKATWGGALTSVGIGGLTGLSANVFSNYAVRAEFPKAINYVGTSFIGTTGNVVSQKLTGNDGIDWTGATYTGLTYGFGSYISSTSKATSPIWGKSIAPGLATSGPSIFGGWMIDITKNNNGKKSKNENKSAR